MDKGSNIQVICRFRPQNTREETLGGAMSIRYSDDGRSLFFADHDFTFDRVFDPRSTQDDVYEYIGKPVLDDILMGVNCTVFAYGQTGSGKTYSMMGRQENYTGVEQESGIIPRLIQGLFDAVNKADSTCEFTLRVSNFEIYCERIKDLLAPGDRAITLDVHEDLRPGGRGIFIRNLTEEYVVNQDEVFSIMERGQANRTVAATQMNEQSSRSHCILSIVISQFNNETQEKKTSKLYLVDLAGSEKVAKTQAEGQTLEEAKKINLSLSALGKVINALSEVSAVETAGKKSSALGTPKHIPYRDSKLTRLLQDSLGGNSRTTLVICCSPATYNQDESLSTLRFGFRAKAIKNKPRINKELSAAELKALLSRVQKENEMLKTQLAAAHDELSTLKGTANTDTDENSSTASTVPRRGSLIRSTTSSVAGDSSDEEDMDGESNEPSNFGFIIQEKETEIYVLRDEISQITDKFNELQKENEVLMDQLVDIRLSHEKAQGQISDLSMSNEMLKEEIISLSEQNLALLTAAAAAAKTTSPPPSQTSLPVPTTEDLPPISPQSTTSQTQQQQPVATNPAISRRLLHAYRLCHTFQSERVELRKLAKSTLDKMAREIQDLGDLVARQGVQQAVHEKEKEKEIAEQIENNNQSKANSEAIEQYIARMDEMRSQLLEKGAAVAQLRAQLDAVSFTLKLRETELTTAQADLERSKREHDHLVALKQDVSDEFLRLQSEIRAAQAREEDADDPYMTLLIKAEQLCEARLKHSFSVVEMEVLKSDHQTDIDSMRQEMRRELEAKEKEMEEMREVVRSMTQKSVNVSVSEMKQNEKRSGGTGGRRIVKSVRGGGAPGSSLHHLMEDVSTHDTDPVPLAYKCGYLDKQGKRLRMWNSRWFVLKGNTLLHYKRMEDAKPKGRISLRNADVIEFDDDGQCCFKIRVGEKFYLFKTASDAERKEWTQAIQEAIELK